MAARPDPLSRDKFWDSTLNVVSGCEPADTSCRNCYAPRLTRVLVEKEVALYIGTTIKIRGKWVWTGVVNELDPDSPIWNYPFKKGVSSPLLGPGRPNIIFLNSMADLFFHRHRPAAVRRLLENISFSRHVGLILTHYPEGMVKEFIDKPDWWRDRFWLLFSAGDQRWFNIRWEIVRPLAERKWITGAALQPLLGPIKLPDDFLHRAKWVTVSGEQGPRSRKMDLDWMRALRDQCFRAGLPIFIEKPEEGFLPFDLCRIWQFPKV